MSKPNASRNMSRSQFFWHVLNQIVFAVWTLQLIRAFGPLFAPLHNVPQPPPMI